MYPHIVLVEVTICHGSFNNNDYNKEHNTPIGMIKKLWAIPILYRLWILIEDIIYELLTMIWIWKADTWEENYNLNIECY